MVQWFSVNWANITVVEFTSRVTIKHNENFSEIVKLRYIRGIDLRKFDNGNNSHNKVYDVKEHNFLFESRNNSNN